jgi:subtilisin family serine protease
MTNNSSKLASVLDSVHQSISSFASASDNDLLETVTITFCTEYNKLALRTIISQWQVGDFSQLPNIEVIDANVLGKANGAYAQSNNKIYVSDVFLATASSSALQSLLLEEIGHYIDAQINSTDSDGDEGAIFSALVQGYKLDDETLLSLKAENDQTTITLGDGQEVLVEQQVAGTTVGRKFVNDEIVIKFQDGVSNETILAFQNSLGAKLISVIPSLNIQLWKIPPTLTVEKVISTYSTDQRIQFIEPNYIENQLASVAPVSASLPIPPNDPALGLQWALNNTGQTGGTPNADINAPEALGILQGRGWLTARSSVVVGVIDTGVDYNHPDLINNIWTNPGEIAGNGVDDDRNGYIDDVHGWDFFSNDNTPLDMHGHGTHVSGIIAADTNNNIGIAGVAYNTTKIMPLQIFNSNGSATSTFNIVAAIAYATANGADLTNNSWGGGGYSNAIYTAIQSAGIANKLFVAAAGNYTSNNDTSPFYPANYSLNNIISVASTDDKDLLSNFSNYGLTTVDLSAPGSSIFSTLSSTNIFSPGNYGYLSGTSMAAPHVSGAAALILASQRSRAAIDQYLSPASSIADMRRFILNNGVDYISSLSGKTVTGGRLDLSQALIAAHKAVRNDFNGDRKADILWRNKLTGNTYIYQQVETFAGLVRNVNLEWQIAGTGDFNSDGRSDILWRNNSSGETYIYHQNKTNVINEGSVRRVGLEWQIAGTGDFNGDGMSDILWRNKNTGDVYIYQMNGLAVASEGSVRTVGLEWQISGTGDFNGDGMSDILWRNKNTGDVYTYLMNGTAVIGEGLVRNVSSDWVIEGVDDFNDDRKSDILWRNSNSGTVYGYLMNGRSVVSEGVIGTIATNLGWNIVGTGDYNGDGKGDILWQNNAGFVNSWQLNGLDIYKITDIGNRQFSNYSNMQIASPTI